MSGSKSATGTCNRNTCAFHLCSITIFYVSSDYPKLIIRLCAARRLLIEQQEIHLHSRLRFNPLATVGLQETRRTGTDGDQIIIRTPPVGDKKR